MSRKPTIYLEELIQVYELYHKGFSQRNIAKQLDMPMSMLVHIYDMLELKSSHKPFKDKKIEHSDDQIAKIKELISNDKTIEEIVKELDITKYQIRQICKTNNLNIIHKNTRTFLSTNNTYKEQVKKFCDEGKSIKQIAITLSITRKKTKSILDELGLTVNTAKHAGIEHTEEQLQKAKELFNTGVGARKIAKKLGITRHRVLSIYEQLGIDASNRNNPRFTYLLTEKCCKTCEIIKQISEFRKRVSRHANGDERIGYEPYCNACVKEYHSTPEYIEICRQRRLKRWANLSEEDRRRLMDIYNERQRKRLAKMPERKLRLKISNMIRFALKKLGSNKNNYSCIKFLPYTIQGLKEYLEKLFEPWMSWDNWGQYKIATWNDNNKSTWTWNLDHIIRQADLPYTSMEDENFKKCWALENLRPYSAKQNIYENYRKSTTL
jgi:transcriptional regulator